MTPADEKVAELPTEPGARLRRHREKAGLSAQQAAERLNLDAGVVVALEQDDYASLGAPVFVRGHLKRYAALLGVAEDEILGAYDRSRAQLAQPSLIPAARVEMAPIRRRPMGPWLAGGAALFLAAAGIASYLGRYGLHVPGPVTALGPEDDAAGALAGDFAAAAPGLAGTSSVAVAGSRAAASSAPQLGSAVPVVPPGQVGLVFDFSGESWVEVYDGTGRTVLYDLGRAGTRSVVSGVPPLSVTLGNPRAVVLAVNGRRVAVPAPPAGQTVARFGIGPDGLPR